MVLLKLLFYISHIIRDSLLFPVKLIHIPQKLVCVHKPVTCKLLCMRDRIKCLSHYRVMHLLDLLSNLIELALKLLFFIW